MQFISLWVSDGNLNRSFNNTSHAIHLFWGVGWNSKTQFLVIALMQSSRLQLSGGTVEPQILIKSPMEFTSQRMSDGQCNANALSSATCAHKSKTHTLKVSCGASVRWSFWADGSQMRAQPPHNPHFGTFQACPSTLCLPRLPSSPAEPGAKRCSIGDIGKNWGLETHATPTE